MLYTADEELDDPLSSHWISKFWTLNLSNNIKNTCNFEIDCSADSQADSITKWPYE